MKYISLLLTLVLTPHAYATEVLYEHSWEAPGAFGITTQTSRIVHNPEKIKALSEQARYPLVVKDFPMVEEHPYGKSGYDIFGMGELRIVQDKDVILHTPDLRDCVGVSVWHPQSKTAALWHAWSMQLTEASNYATPKQFLDELRKLIQDPSEAVVNLVSAFWSQHLFTVIDLLKDGGFHISGLDIPDALLEFDENVDTRYLDKTTVSAIYLNPECRPAVAMSINSKTGEVSFRRYSY